MAVATVTVVHHEQNPSQFRNKGSRLNLGIKQKPEHQKHCIITSNNPSRRNKGSKLYLGSKQNLNTKWLLS